ncbi:MAG: pyridoxal phosphate-dependent aminotransferase [Chloroflexota bacterium]
MLTQRVQRLTKRKGAIWALEKAQALEAQGRRIIHLEIGEPDFATPEHIIEAGVRAMRNGRSRYGAPLGTSELRTAVAKTVSATRETAVSPDRVIITPGSKAAIYFGMMALIEKGDEVIVPNPGFPAYASITNMTGGTAVSWDFSGENGFRPDVDLLRTLITPRTKMIALNSPGNPTGVVFSRSEIEQIAAVALENDLYVLADEIYMQLHYGEMLPASILSIPGMAERTIVIDGFSKTYAMTGWRLGYGVFPQALVNPIQRMIVNDHTCVPQFIQDAGVVALTGSQACVTEMREAYRARRDLVVSAFNQMPGVQCHLPGGAFYAMPSIKGLPVDNVLDFLEMLIQEAGVSMIPATSFGSQGAGYLRVAYANSLANLGEAMEKITAVLQQKYG